MKLQNIPEETINSLQWYLGNTRVLREVFGDELIDSYPHDDIVEYPNRYPRNVKCLRVTTTDPVDLTEYTDLRYLSISGLGIQELPQLPDTLDVLDCHTNQLTKIHKLPRYLKSLRCYSNQITELPPLPEGLREILCHENRITQFPELPESIEFVSIGDNNIQEPPRTPPTTLSNVKCWYV